MNHRPRPALPPDPGPPPQDPPAAAGHSWSCRSRASPGGSTRGTGSPRRSPVPHWNRPGASPPASVRPAAGIRASRPRPAGALTVMLASHVPGQKIPWSALVPALRPRDLSISRTAEILALAGLLDDDRVPAWTPGPSPGSPAWPRASRPAPEAGCTPCGTEPGAPGGATPPPSACTCAASIRC